MNTVEIGHIKRYLPASWNELTREQLLIVAKELGKQATKVDFKVRLLFSFLHLKYKVFRNIDGEDAYFLGETLNYILEGVSLTKNLIPKIKRFYGPADSLSNITFGEFVRLQMVLDEYGKNKDDRLLDDLVAIIYRPSKFAWWIRKYFTEKTDRRRKLIDRTYPKRVKAMSKVDLHVKYAVLLFVTGVFNSLPKVFPNIYSQKAKSSEEKTGWIDVIISLADGKTDDESLDKIYNSNLYNVFYGMEKSANDYHKFQREHPELFKND